MSEEQAILEWQKLLDSKQTVLKYRNALAGDGGGTVDVSGEPGFIWCRYSADQSKVSKVFNMIAPGVPEDFPIKVGRRFPEDEFEQVLVIDWTLYQDIVSQDTVDNFTTGNHGESHNAADGADPAPIDLRNIVEMRGRAQATADLTIHVEQGQYVYGYQDVHRYPGENVDLTASVPAGAGHRYVLVYVDGETNAASFDNSVVVPLAATPVIPDLRANTIPICIVDLTNGQTTITEDDIFDWRFLWDLVTFAAPVLIGTNAERLALVVANLAELTRFYTTDTDKIWEIWEAAWRLVHEPSGLSLPSGASGTPLTVDASGNLTNSSQDFILDKGAGDSGAVLWRGGSNDDEIQVYLNDDAVAGDSDLEMNLADGAGDSKFNITANGGIPTVFSMSSLGIYTQLTNDAVTAALTTMQTITHTTTGTAADDFGTRILYQLEDSAGNTDDAAAIDVEWEDATTATEDANIDISVRVGGSLVQRAQIDGDGVKVIGDRILQAVWRDYEIADTTEGDHFRQNAATFPTGWTETDAPAGSATSTVFSFWTITGTSANATWDYRKQTGVNIENLGASAWASFVFGPIFIRDGGFTADVDYYFQICGSTVGVINTAEYVRVHLQWDSAGTQWRIQGESDANDGGGQTASGWFVLDPVPLMPLFFRVAIRNDAGVKTTREYYSNLGDPGLAQAHATQMQSVGENTTWGQVWWRINQTRGAGISDVLYIGKTDYWAGAN